MSNVLRPTVERNGNILTLTVDLANAKPIESSSGLTYLLASRGGRCPEAGTFGINGETLPITVAVNVTVPNEHVKAALKSDPEVQAAEKARREAIARAKAIRSGLRPA